LTARTQTAAQWVEEVFVMATPESQNIFFAPALNSTNQSGVEAILALPIFLNKIPHQKEPKMSVGYI
jgi:hypothetical protein